MAKVLMVSNSYDDDDGPTVMRKIYSVHTGYTVSGCTVLYMRRAVIVQYRFNNKGHKGLGNKATESCKKKKKSNHTVKNGLKRDLHRERERERAHEAI